MSLEQYNTIYKDSGFERLELFKAIHELFHPETVLYPGSSVHVTPSFVFQNVTYVDKSDISRSFFSDLDSVRQLIERNCSYRPRPYIRFLDSDIKECKELQQDYYDLVFTSYSGSLSPFAWKYVRKGGIYVSNNHDSDTGYLLSEKDSAFIGYFEKSKKIYRFIESTDTANIRTPPVSYRGDRSGRIQYLENERFYVFKRIYSPIRGD